MNKKTSIILHLPQGYENVRIFKQIDIDEHDSMLIEVLEENANDATADHKVFFCYQDRVQTVFVPLDYAYIESTSNHYSRWHPIDPQKPILDIYTKSLGELFKKLHGAGLTMFWRIHSSYIVNSRCITKFADGNVFLRNQRSPLPIGERFKIQLKDMMIMIK